MQLLFAPCSTDKDSINQKDDYGNTALCYAASYLHSEVVDELLKAGASVWACARMKSPRDPRPYKGPACMMNACTMPCNVDGGNAPKKQKVIDALAKAGAPLPTKSEVAFEEKKLAERLVD